MLRSTFCIRYNKTRKLYFDIIALLALRFKRYSIYILHINPMLLKCIVFLNHFKILQESSADNLNYPYFKIAQL